MKDSNGSKAAEVKIDVEAKDNKGNLLGSGRCFAYSTDEAGYNAAKKRSGVKEVMKAYNRQIKTDCRNALARPKSAVKELVSLIKGQPKLRTTIIAAIRADTEMSETEKTEILTVIAAV